MATMTNSKSHVNKWKSGALPTKIGRRTIHPSKQFLFCLQKHQKDACLIMLPFIFLKTHDLFSMMVPDAADYMERIN
ncbi:unnamed protein product, partial [Brassica rapa subsp. narinosa]